LPNPISPTPYTQMFTTDDAVYQKVTQAPPNGQRVIVYIENITQNAAAVCQYVVKEAGSVAPIGDGEVLLSCWNTAANFVNGKVNAVIETDGEIWVKRTGATNAKLAVRSIPR
jgi:hypothetical protein